MTPLHFKSKIIQPRILYPVKRSFLDKTKVRAFSDKQKLKEFEELLQQTFMKRNVKRYFRQCKQRVIIIIGHGISVEEGKKRRCQKDRVKVNESINGLQNDIMRLLKLSF